MRTDGAVSVGVAQLVTGPQSPQAPRPAPGGQRLLDRSAIGLSGLCLLHCLAFPAIIAMLPALGDVLPRQWWVHPLILAAAAPLAAIALWRGWRRHRDVRPGVAGIAGVALLAFGLASGEGSAAEIVLTVAGALVLASAHGLNWRLDHGRRDTPAMRD